MRSSAPAPVAIAAAGAVSLAVAMGIGRFAFTPMLPLMMRGGANDATFLHDGAEDLQRLEINGSHGENDRSELFICGARPFWF